MSIVRYTVPQTPTDILSHKLPKHGLFSLTEMDAYLKTDLTAIVVDYDFYMNDKYANRMRFSLAHEVGHFFLHKNVLLALDLIDPVAWKNFILDLPEDEYSNFEWQAIHTPCAHRNIKFTIK